MVKKRNGVCYWMGGEETSPGWGRSQLAVRQSRVKRDRRRGWLAARDRPAPRRSTPPPSRPASATAITVENCTNSPRRDTLLTRGSRRLQLHANTVESPSLQGNYFGAEEFPGIKTTSAYSSQ
ncbi:hypothetical protein Aduo_001705 [Ancylostoma duodenale]